MVFGPEVEFTGLGGVGVALGYASLHGAQPSITGRNHAGQAGILPQ